MADWMKQLITAFSEKGGDFHVSESPAFGTTGHGYGFCDNDCVGTIFRNVLCICHLHWLGLRRHVNCFVNYEWTFKCHECKKSHVIIKYTLVWAGSVFLNTYGTYYLTEWIAGISWVRDTLSLYSKDLFIVPKIVVSILVALFWNYYLQRVFVYRNVNMKNLFKRENKL